MAYRYRRMRKHGWRRSRSPDATACGVADYTSDSDSEEDKYHWRQPAPSDGGNGDRRRYWRERSDGGKGDRRRLRSVSRPRADRRRRSRSRGVSRSRARSRAATGRRSRSSPSRGAAEGRDRGRRGRRRSSKRPPQGPQGGRSRGSKRPRQGPQRAATGAASRIRMAAATSSWLTWCPRGPWIPRGLNCGHQDFWSANTRRGRRLLASCISFMDNTAATATRQ